MLLPNVSPPSASDTRTPIAFTGEYGPDSSTPVTLRRGDSTSHGPKRTRSSSPVSVSLHVDGADAENGEQRAVTLLEREAELLFVTHPPTATRSPSSYTPAPLPCWALRSGWGQERPRRRSMSVLKRLR
ncbi:hypothetical protein GCM10020220_072390 [Nonomuraea rubra]